MGKIISFLSPKYEEVTIGDQSLKFYPVSVKAAMRLRLIGKPLASALTTFMTSTAQDAGKVTRQTVNPREGVTVDVKESSAISPEIATLRLRQQSEAVEKLIDALTEKSSAVAVAAVIFDSLRDDMARTPTDVELLNWIEALDLETTFAFLKGVALANKGVFGPLGDKVLARGKAALDGHLAGTKAEEPVPATSP